MALVQHWGDRLEKPSFKIEPDGDVEGAVAFVGKPPFFELVRARYPQVVIVPANSVRRAFTLGKDFGLGQQAALYFPGLTTGSSRKRKPKIARTDATKSHDRIRGTKVAQESKTLSDSLGGQFGVPRKNIKKGKWKMVGKGGRPGSGGFGNKGGIGGIGI